MRTIVRITLICSCLLFQAHSNADEWSLAEMSSDQYYKITRTVPSDASPCDLTCVNKVYPYAKLSQGTYKAQDLKSWEGWNRSDVDIDSSSVYRASIYMNEERKEIVIAYAGTDDKYDILTDIAQYIGRLPHQYTYGIATALKHLESNDNNYSVTLTGHSLGGAIAQYVAKVLDQKAITFNSAPIDRAIAIHADELNAEYAMIKPSVLGSFSVLNIVALDEKQKYDFVADTKGELLGTTKFLNVLVHEGWDILPETLERHAIQTIIDQLESVKQEQATLSSEKACDNGPAIEKVKFNDVVHCSMDNPGDIDVYAIELNKGDSIHATAYTTGGDDCKGFQPKITAFDSKNKRLASSNRGQACLGTRIVFVAEETNTYTFTVNDYYGKNIGNYNIEFQCASGGCVNNTLLAKQECSATFDGSNLSVPQLEFDDKDFWVDFKLISADPIQVQLTGFGEK